MDHCGTRWREGIKEELQPRTVHRIMFFFSIVSSGTELKVCQHFCVLKRHFWNGPKCFPKTPHRKRKYQCCINYWLSSSCFPFLLTICSYKVLSSNISPKLLMRSQCTPFCHVHCDSLACCWTQPAQSKVSLCWQSVTSTNTGYQKSL